MWDKARSLAAKHLKPAFDNLKIVSTENQPTNPPEVSEAAGENALTQDPVEALAAVTAERDQLRVELADLQDRMLRRQAEFENFRRRQERDRSDFLQYAGMEIGRELLPVLDDFERALKTETSDAGYRKGVELIYQRLLETLKRIGLQPIDAAIGPEFDPNLLQAVLGQQRCDAPDNTIPDACGRAA